VDEKFKIHTISSSAAGEAHPCCEYVHASHEEFMRDSSAQHLFHRKSFSAADASPQIL
jgi:hypothetical protein